MFKQIDYTMVVVSDMQRSVEFYRDKLGIPLKLQSPDWTEFQTGTTTLALHGGGIAPSGMFWKQMAGSKWALPIRSGSASSVRIE